MKAKVRKQKVIIQFSPTNGAGDWWIMLDDGTVLPGLESPREAFKIATRLAKPRNPGITITTIEWRNVPKGFKPPTGKEKVS